MGGYTDAVAHTHTHANMHTCTHTQRHAHTHTHTHMHTGERRALSCSRSVVVWMNVSVIFCRSNQRRTEETIQRAWRSEDHGRAPSADSILRGTVWPSCLCVCLVCVCVCVCVHARVRACLYPLLSLSLHVGSGGVECADHPSHDMWHAKLAPGRNGSSSPHKHRDGMGSTRPHLHLDRGAPLPASASEMNFLPRGRGKPQSRPGCGQG